jgi:tetratricopeptide (TPR) repeat protein
MVGSIACAAKPAATPPPVHPVVYATPTVITPHEDESPTDAFQHARAMLLEGRAAEAAPIFDRLALANSSPEMSQVARFNAGVAWEQTGDRAKALDRFRDVIEHYPTGDAGKWGGIRAARIQAYLEQWAQLSSTADVLLARTDLTDVEHLEAYGSKALAIVEAGDADGAERFVLKGRDIIDVLRLGEGGKLPLEVAQIHFALGEIRRLRSEAIVFVPVPANFAEVLERRCQGLLDAQSAYSDAMRSYDAHWAAMSGFRIGALYQHLHQDVINVPPPKAANTPEKRQLFEGAMRLRYRILLQKGLTMMEHTIMLGERTGEASPWIDRAREAKGELEKSLLEQKSALAKLPYTEKELQKALDDLAKKPP